MVAAEATVRSAALVAVTVVVVVEPTLIGGVYNPPVVRLPTTGFMLHVTATFDEPFMKAVSCWAEVPA